MRTPKANKIYYFAYGSNCNLEQMARRCPKAKKVGAVTLDGYKLTFNGKHSGTGVASIKRKKGAIVNGLLWEITQECEKSLDIYEGFPHLYTKKTVTVKTADGTEIEAMVYVMTSKYNAPALPSQAYYWGIRDGFIENGIDPHTLQVALTETYNAIQMESEVI